MKKNLVLCLMAFLSGCLMTRQPIASVRIELRLASQTPGTGLIEMTVPGSEKSVYVSGEAVLGNADIRSARVVSEGNGPQVEISFTKAGSKKFAVVTGENIGKPLAILVDGKLISAPVVMDRITGGRAVISGRFSDEEATRIAETFNRK